MHDSKCINRSTAKDFTPWSFFMLKNQEEIIFNQCDLLEILVVFVWRHVYEDNDVLQRIYVDVHQEN